LPVDVGCVDDNPIVSGHRLLDAGAEAEAPVTVVTPKPDDQDVDGADCRHCQETLNTDTSRGVLCHKNNVGGVSSVELLNQLVQCVCYDKCIDQCGSYCSGSKNTSACQSCLTSNCLSQFNLCLGDTKPQ